MTKPEPLKGKWKHSEETKRKISNSLKGHFCYKNEDRNKKISLSLKGKTYNEIHGEKNAKKLLEKRKNQMLNNKFSNGRKGNKNNYWKGNQASYTAKHMFIYKLKGKANKCELLNCKANIYHWANISRKHKRESNDYISLCPSCHSFVDKHDINIPTLLLFKVLMEKKYRFAVEWLEERQAEEWIKYEQGDTSIDTLKYALRTHQLKAFKDVMKK